MKTLNKVLIIHLSLAWFLGFPLLAYSERISLDDIISNRIIKLRLLDRCGDEIPSDRAAFDRCKSQSGGHEKSPPLASEACAYDRIGDQLRLSFDEAQVSEDNIVTNINVYDESNSKIYDNKIKQIPFKVHKIERREESWLLEKQGGGGLNVGREGKKYTIQLERRNVNNVVYSSGKLGVFVDDCRVRNNKILQLIEDETIHHSPGFDLYLKLLNRVSTKLCNKIEVGLLANNGIDSFTQRCRYQCINNYFTNKMIDSTALPLGADDHLNKTHLKVSLQKANALHYVDNQRWGGSWVNARFSLLAYITMEDNYRAEGYANCNGPLNTADADASVDVIAEAVDEIVLEVPGLNLTGIGEKLIGQIQMHLERTDELYNNIVGSK